MITVLALVADNLYQIADFIYVLTVIQDIAIISRVADFKDEC